MMQSYVPTLCVVGVYLLMAVAGPRIMANRQPLNVQLPMLIYIQLWLSDIVSIHVL